MSSGFVSGGTVDEPKERDEAWLQAQQEIENKRRLKEEQSRQGDVKSLYETLQANKAAKQEAFEESIRLRNQFRSLHEDEVDFLDSVLESTRAKDAEVKRETAEQLELFRRQQEEAEKATAGNAPAVAEEVTETWAVGGRKRKKGREKEALGGVKIRRTSTAEKTTSSAAGSPFVAAAPSQAASLAQMTAVRDAPPKVAESATKRNSPAVKATTTPKAPSPPTAVLGLVGYSSDEDD